MADVTQILNALAQGDSHAAEQLLPLVYDELRKLAAEKMALELPGQTLQATALVHEAYLRLVDVQQAQHWDSRGHFFAACAEAMRRILIDQARRRRSLKRGGGMQRVELDADALFAAPEDPAAEDLLALDEALRQFEAEEPLKARLEVAPAQKFSQDSVFEAGRVRCRGPNLMNLIESHQTARDEEPYDQQSNRTRCGDWRPAQARSRKRRAAEPAGLRPVLLWGSRACL